jgi:hypothetical protein
MATAAEILAIFRLLRDAYPAFRPENPDGVIDLWLRKFAATPAAVLARAADL